MGRYQLGLNEDNRGLSDAGFKFGNRIKKIADNVT